MLVLSEMRSNVAMHHDMSRIISFPPSFPNTEEELFLELLLGERPHFPRRWQEWRDTVVFDDIDFATLRLLPLLYMRLCEAGITDDTYVGKIRGVYRMVWARNQRLLEEVSVVATALREKGIDVVLLKGLALLIDVYRDPAARFLGDGDVLIKKDAVPQACAILRASGWTCTDPSVAQTDDFDYSGLFAVTHALTFRNRNGVEIEVHWSVFHVELERELSRLLLLAGPRHNLDGDDFWSRARPLMLKDVPVKILSHEDMFVHVIVHGAEGNESHRTLRWVVDAAYIVNATPLDWDRVLECTQHGGHVVAMQYGIAYLNDRMQVNISSEFISKLMRLPYSHHAHTRYMRRARVWYPLFGNFPLLWYRYWKFESRGSFFKRLHAFLPYLKRAWSIAPKESIIGFVCKKYYMRIMRRFGGT